MPAGDALARSLNIPAVRMLQIMNEERFLSLLHRMGFTSFDKPASHYGLSLILGGGETSLWELSGVYASMARVLNNINAGKDYHAEDWHMPVLITERPPAQSGDFSHKPVVGSDTLNRKSQIANRKSETSSIITNSSQTTLSAPAIWLTYEALRRVNRPETETGWQYFGSMPDIAWKTGTSFGYRDAWAIGTTPEYVVAVWAGNADGEGRPGLSGISSAAPVLFDIFRLLQPARMVHPLPRKA